MKSLVCAALLAFASATAGNAFAQTETRAAIAEGLYRQARDLMAAGKYDEACPKFAESQRLDPATGTLLNLAACHEKQGKLATAWIEYGAALLAARRDQREDRVEYARQRVTELEPKLSRLTLVQAPGAEQTGLTLELDNATVSAAVIGVPMPIDPGLHTVRATAPGKKAWAQTLEIGALADQKTLTIPILEDAPPEPVAAPSPLPAPPAMSARIDEDELSVRPVPTAVYLLGGVTLALGVGAGVTGIAYLNKKEAYEDERPKGDTPKLDSRFETARNFGYLNLGLWAATAVGAGVTTYLYFARPGRVETARLTPWAGPKSAGLSMTGGF